MAYRGFSTTPEGIKVVHAEITPGADDLSPRPTVLYIETDGSVTMTDESGTSLEYTVKAGQVLPFSPVKITAATATVYGWR